MDRRGGAGGEVVGPDDEEGRLADDCDNVNDNDGDRRRPCLGRCHHAQTQPKLRYILISSQLDLADLRSPLQPSSWTSAMQISRPRRAQLPLSCRLRLQRGLQQPERPQPVSSAARTPQPVLSGGPYPGSPIVHRPPARTHTPIRSRSPALSHIRMPLFPGTLTVTSTVHPARNMHDAREQQAKSFPDRSPRLPPRS